jgi:hypothetical protein
MIVTEFLSLVYRSGGLISALSKNANPADSHANNAGSSTGRTSLLTGEFIRRSFLCQLAAAVGILLLSLPADAQTKMQVKPFTVPEYKYITAVPTGWTQKKDLPMPMIAFLAPEENGYRANYSVNVFSKSVKPNEEKAFLLSVVSEYKKQKAKISPPVRTKLGGSPAWRWSATLSVPDFPTVENRQVVCFHANRAYILTYTFLPELRAKYSPIFERLLTTFRFQKTAAKSSKHP